MHANGSAVDQRLRIAVIGCGDISAIHLEAITANPAAVLVAVCDAEYERAAGTAQRLGCNAYSDFPTMVDVERPDVVHICTPHHLHVGMAVECLRRNVDVVLEKPLATTVADGQAVADAAKASGAQLAVCFQNRYNDTSQALHAALQAGELGRVLGGRAGVAWFRDEAYYRQRPWRGSFATAGGGVLINQAIHTLDLLQWYLGPALEVDGQAARLFLPAPVEVEDTAMIRMLHEGGTTSIFHATNGHVANAPVFLELVGEKGTARLDTDLMLTGVDGTTRTVSEARTATGERSYWGASHARLIDDFYRHVRSGRPFWIDAAQAMQTLSIVTSVYEQSMLRS